VSCYQIGVIPVEQIASAYRALAPARRVVFEVYREGPPLLVGGSERLLEVARTLELVAPGWHGFQAL
jgi:hypothetical protein